MSQSHPDQRVGFAEPACYRIVVQGHLDEHIATHIGDITIDQANAMNTSLTVRVMDQAGLSGVLDTLYGLHLSILSVELLDNNKVRAH